MKTPIPQAIQNQSKNFGLGELHPKEVGLIYMIRHLYRFGIIEITTADGLPKQFRKREYTQIVPEGIPDIDPTHEMKKALDFMHKLAGLDVDGIGGL